MCRAVMMRIRPARHIYMKAYTFFLRNADLKQPRPLGSRGTAGSAT
jgi:hypothetical protein